VQPTATVLKRSGFDITTPTGRIAIHGGSGHRPPTVSDLGLLASCRQVHYEASEVFYNKIFRAVEGPTIYAEDLDVGLADSGRFSQIPVIPRTYAQFVRRIEYGPLSSERNGSSFMSPMIHYLQMIRLWPALSSIKLSFEVDASSIKEMREWMLPSGSREHCVDKLVGILREVCRIQEIRIPKDLETKASIKYADNANGEVNVTILYDAIKRVKGLKRL
jgi:hypothetical protein